jgi:hypothetical protein
MAGTGSIPPMSASAEVERFAALAARYARWCESPHDDVPPAEFQAEILRNVAGLYEAALYLPDLEYAEAPEPPAPRPEKRIVIQANFPVLPFRDYWEVFAPSKTAETHAAVRGDLLDDIADLYFDIAPGLWLFQRGHVTSAVFAWRFAFGIHWGRHALSMMRALHSFDSEDEQSVL